MVISGFAFPRFYYSLLLTCSRIRNFSHSSHKALGNCFFYGSHGFRKRKQRKIRDVLLGGQDSFVIPAGTDFTHFWSCFFLFRRYVISNFYFSKYSTLIRLDAFTSLTIKSLVLLQFHFPSIFVIFTKKWILVRGGAKSEDFHKTVSNLPPDFFFVQSWQIIFGSTFKNCRYLCGTLRLFCHSLHFTCSF